MIVVAALASSEPPASPIASDSATQLRQRTQQRMDANAAADRSFYERLLAPSFLMQEPYVFPPHTGQAYLDAEFTPGRAPPPTSTVTGFPALVDGDTALVSYQPVEPYPVGGDQHFDLLSRRLDTYVRTKDCWHLLAMGIAEPPSWTEVAKIDPELYSDRAGTYRSSPTNAVRVTNEACHLMAEVTGQDNVEQFPENATTPSTEATARSPGRPSSVTPPARWSPRPIEPSARRSEPCGCRRWSSGTADRSPCSSPRC